MYYKCLFFLIMTTFSSRILALKSFDQSHKTWSIFLQKNITISGHASKVNYKAIKTNSKELENYLANLEVITQSQFKNFTKNEKLAFLINAYNAFTIKLIVDHYPVKSIKDIGGFLGNPWKLKFFKLFGESKNLDNIEHDMIRNWFNEPRIHFAVVCASVGCPSLQNVAFTRENLDQLLEKAALNFLTDFNKNQYLSDKKQLNLSSIFKWYGDDFVKKNGSLENFLATRITSDLEQQKSILNKESSIVFLDYDWSLNE